jgi:hypothetical protein
MHEMRNGGRMITKEHNYWIGYLRALYEVEKMLNKFTNKKHYNIIHLRDDIDKKYNNATAKMRHMTKNKKIEQ